LGSDLSLKLWCDPELAQRAIAEVEQIIKRLRAHSASIIPCLICRA